jgi:heptosyltransferase I
MTESRLRFPHRKMTLPLVNPPKSICLLRLSALGDVTHVAPIIRTLQAHWPQTHLTWIIGKREAELMSDLPLVELITFNKEAGLSAYRKLHRRLSARRFDVMLNMQVSLRASMASLGVKAFVRLGYDRARAKDLHGLFINHRIPAGDSQHVLDSFFSFLEALGLHERELRWDIPIPAEAQFFAERQIPPGQRALVISPCSSHALRNWRADRYAKVADHAVQRWDMQVLLCGGPTVYERKYGEAIAYRMHHRPVNLVGKDTVKRLLALLARATVLLSPDSGPVHMATCVGTPVVGLYAATNPERSGPYLSRSWCVDKYDAAARRFRGKPASELAWGTKLEYPGVMELIEVDEVIQQLDDLMNDPQARTRNVPNDDDA